MTTQWQQTLDTWSLDQIVDYILTSSDNRAISSATRTACVKYGVEAFEHAVAAWVAPVGIKSCKAWQSYEDGSAR